MAVVSVNLVAVAQIRDPQTFQRTSPHASGVHHTYRIGPVYCGFCQTAFGLPVNRSSDYPDNYWGPIIAQLEGLQLFMYPTLWYMGTRVCREVKRDSSGQQRVSVFIIYIYIYIYIYTHTHTHTHTHTVGSRFTMALRSRIFGCKSNRRKTSTV